MTALIAVHAGDGCTGRCDAKCTRLGPGCHCICQGANHGAGGQEAIDNTRELAESWLEQARADGSTSRMRARHRRPARAAVQLGVPGETPRRAGHRRRRCAGRATRGVAAGPELGPARPLQLTGRRPRRAT